MFKFNDLAKRMLEYRAKNHISAKEFAKLCGISLQTVYSIENGHQNPSKTTVIKIEEVMKTDLIKQTIFLKKE